VYRVSQSGQESEETHLSDTLVNYSNDAQVNRLRISRLQLHLVYVPIVVIELSPIFYGDQSRVE